VHILYCQASFLRQHPLYLKHRLGLCPQTTYVLLLIDDEGCEFDHVQITCLERNCNLLLAWSEQECAQYICCLLKQSNLIVKGKSDVHQLKSKGN
jgi:hypothetical protein